MSKKQDDLKYLFIGGTQHGYKLLKSVVNEKFIPAFAYILKEDKHEEVKYSGKISKLLKKNKIGFELRKSLTEKDNESILKSGYDFALVYGWRSMIKIDLGKKESPMFIAVHNSLLPQYRGFAPLQWAVINGEKESGITMFKINNGEVDSGDIILQRKIKIGENEFISEIIERFSEEAIYMFGEFRELYLKGELKFRKQRERDATYTCKRIPEDGRIDWSRSSAEIYNTIRALSDSSHCAFCHFKGCRYYINDASYGKFNKLKYAGRIPGRVCKIYKDGIEVLCGKGSVIIKEWTKGKKGRKNCPSIIIKSIKETLK